MCVVKRNCYFQIENLRVRKSLLPKSQFSSRDGLEPRSSSTQRPSAYPLYTGVRCCIFGQSALPVIDFIWIIPQTIINDSVVKNPSLIWYCTSVIMAHTVHHILLVSQDSTEIRKCDLRLRGRAGQRVGGKFQEWFSGPCRVSSAQRDKW